MTRGEVYKLTWLLSTSVEILGQNQATYVSEDITENITDCPTSCPDIPSVSTTSLENHSSVQKQQQQHQQQHQHQQQQQQQQQ
uniref:Uncharacterized protein n=1 Tax=Vespula pensylvanica TaxID=30213 RepID=A0A834JT22_VESPE|nr:hypothetical protein H0235_016913 [Vespula pensylvanica]